MGCRRTKSNRGKEYGPSSPFRKARRKRRTRRGGAPAAQHEAAKRAIRDYNIRKQLAVKAAGFPGHVLPAVSPAATNTAGIQASADPVLLGPHRAPSTDRRMLAPSIRALVRARSRGAPQSEVTEEERKYDYLLNKWVKENQKKGGHRTRKHTLKNRSVRAKNRKVRRRRKSKAKRTRAKRTRAKRTKAKKGGAPAGADNPLLDMDAFSDKPLRVLEQIINDTYEFDEKGIPIGYKMPAGMDPDDLIHQHQPRKGKAAMDDLHERKSIHLPPGWDCRKDGAWGEWKYYGSHVPGGDELEHAVHPVLPEPWEFELDEDGDVVAIVNLADGTRNMDYQHPLDTDGIVAPKEDGALLFSVDDYVKWGEKKNAADELDDALYGEPSAERDTIDLGNAGARRRRQQEALQEAEDGDALPAFFDLPDDADDDIEDNEDGDDDE